MTSRNAEDDLRLGILAAQTGLVSPEAVLAAARTSRAADESLDQVLVRVGVLKAEEQTLLQSLNERLIAKKLSCEPVGWSADLAEALGNLPIRVPAASPGNSRDDSPAASSANTPLVDTLIDPSPPSHFPQAHSPAAGSSPPEATPPESPAADSLVAFARAVASPARAVDPPAPKGDSPRSKGLSSRFRVVRLHARGGLGQVSLAIDEELRREVALKEIRSAYVGDSQSRARFEREALITGSLEHPGIVPVYGMGVSENGSPYYAMRFIQGRSMKEAIEEYHDARTKKSPETAMMLRQLLRRFIDMCNAVEYAHSRGIVHRDLKPDNVMLGSYGETLVVDWGLARQAGRPEVAGAPTPALPVADSPKNDASNPAVADPQSPDSEKPPADSDVMLAESSGPGGRTPGLAPGRTPGSDVETRHGSAMGTPAFMSPEQAHGDWATVGPRSDVYSLGATLYQLLAGETAFYAYDVRDILCQVREGDFSPPRKVLATIPPALDAVCLKAMALRPADRYTSARELAGDIERWLADEPTSCYRERFHERWFRRMRRHRNWTTALAVTLPLLSIVMAAAAVWVDGERREAVRQKGISDQAKASEAEQRQIADIATDDARRRLVDLLLSGGDRLQSEGDIGGAMLWYAKALPQLEAQHSSAVPTHRLRLALLLRQLPRLAVAWSLPSEHRGRIARQFVSPDGRKVVFTGRTVVGVDAESGRPLWPPLPFPEKVEVILFAGFSPDSSRLVTLAPERSFRVWNAQSGQPLTADLKTAADFPLVGDGADGSAEISADNRSLVIVTTPAKGRAVEVWDLASGKRRFPPLEFSGELSCVHFSPDGRELLVGTAGEVRFFSAEDGKPSGSPIAVAVLWDAVYSPDARQIATSSGENDARLWSAATHAAAGPPLPHRGPVTRVVFSPDSKRLLTLCGDHTGRLWDVATGKPVGDTLEHAERPYSGAFSDDGLRVVTVTYDHTVQLWNTADGRRIAAPLRHPVEPAVRATTDQLLVIVNNRGGRWDFSRSVELSDVAIDSKELAEVRHLAFSPDGNTLIAAAGEKIRLLEPDGRNASVGPFAHGAVVRALAVSPDGRRFATGGEDGTVRLWSLPDGRSQGPPLKHQGPIVQLRFDVASRRLLTASEDGTARIWDAETGSPIGEPLVHKKGVRDVDFSPDGRFVMTASDDGTVRIWNAADGRPDPGERSRVSSELGMSQARFHPQGDAALAAGVAGTVTVWKPFDAGSKVLTFRFPGAGVDTAAFSPDGRFLLAAGNSNVMQVWNYQSPESPPAVMAVASAAFHAQFRSDSAVVAASGFDGVRIWECDGGRPLGMRLGPLSRALAFSPDGRRLVGVDDRLRFWDLTPDNHMPEDLEKLVELSAMRELDGRGNVHFLTGAQLESLRRDLSTRHPEDFRPNRGKVIQFADSQP